MSKRARATCNDCYFRRHGLCALPGDTPCPTFRAVSRGALAYLKNHSAANGKVGAVGFCWGGGAVNNLAVADPTLDAGVPFYGRQPPADRVPAIRASRRR